MKKLLAILLAALLLCAMIPFATVAAADEPTIQIVIEDDVLEVGDEFEVTVNLLNIPSPGLIGAQISLDWDDDALEIVTYYDEDEDDNFPMIDVNTKYTAKYVQFGPLGTCNVQYLRATAKENQTRYEEWFFTATFRVKDGAKSGDYTVGLKNFNVKNLVLYGNANVAWTIETATITVNGSEPSCEHEYEYDCSTTCSKCGEESRPEAEHQYFYACEQYCMSCGEKTNPRAKHSILHVEAKAPISCIEYGNVEYWYCEHCYHAWLDET